MSKSSKNNSNSFRITGPMKFTFFENKEKENAFL